MTPHLTSFHIDMPDASPLPLPPLRIRPIEARDDAAIAAIIRSVMPEFGACGSGFAINDPDGNADPIAHR